MISSHNLNYKNFWSGEWLSLWQLNQTSENTFEIKGNLRANTYYYEEGNIQFNLKTDFEEKLTETNLDEALAKELVELIENKENGVQIDLDTVYENFSDNYIKPLRRKLPGKFLNHFF